MILSHWVYSILRNNIVKIWHHFRLHMFVCIFWQLFLELMQVPRVESKLRVYLLKIQLRSQVKSVFFILRSRFFGFLHSLSGFFSCHVGFDLSCGLNVVNSAAEEVRNLSFAFLFYIARTIEVEVSFILLLWILSDQSSLLEFTVLISL